MSIYVLPPRIYAVYVVEYSLINVYQSPFIQFHTFVSMQICFSKFKPFERKKLDFFFGREKRLRAFVKFKTKDLYKMKLIQFTHHKLTKG